MWLVIAAVIFFLIALNALYVAAEFGAVSARPSRVRIRADQGSRLAAILVPIVDDPVKLDRYIAACQIGITISSLVLGAYGQATIAPVLAPLFGRVGGMQEVAAQSASAAVVLIALTITQMVLGELVPKAFAVRYPVRTAMYTVVPMRWSLRALSWFIVVLNGSGLAILRLMGVKGRAHRHIHSADEIELLISESRDLEPDDHLRLSNALRLGNRPVRQLMVPRRSIAAISIETPLEEVYRIAAESPFTRLPVYRKSVDNIIGILHTKDLVRNYVTSRKPRTLGQMLRKVTHVPDSATADQLLHAFREERTHQAIVVDEFGGVDGLVTIEDLVTDVLGEISDEFKEGAPRPQRLPDGRVRLPGLLRHYEAEPWVGVLWQGESETVGGLVTEMLGHIPSAGETIVIEGVEVEVAAVDGNKVSWVVATPAAGEEDD